MLLDTLRAKNLIHPPEWLCGATAYLTLVGSMAYGATSESSDWDIYGFCMPPKALVFPHLAGEIMDFGTQQRRFAQWSEHHVPDRDHQREYDFTVYGIVKYVQLVMENNPNMIDSLFTPPRCVLHGTKISEHLRSNRKLFLHAGSAIKFKAYAYSQLNKIRTRTNPSNPARAEMVQTFGFDVKYAMHLVRLLAEGEQILLEGDLDLERNNEQLRSIRRGEWSLEQIERHFADKERVLENLYSGTKLPHRPDEARIKQLLIDCMEMHYGSLSAALHVAPPIERLLGDLTALVQRYSKEGA